MKPVLDVCCGSRMFYFDKSDERVLFGDIRSENHVLCDGRALEIKPDVLIDFTKLPFADKSFKLVVFDPPHLNNVGASSWMAKKYGRLTENWQQMIKDGFAECFRVLDENSVLIFKWNETQIPLSEILSLTPHKPLFGHRSGKASKTHWITFLTNQTEKGRA